jgi:ABC-type Mn2+/Zn2+ transport system permease subunit
MIFLEMISYQFMQRAFVTGAILSLLLAALGIFVTVRKMAFFGDGIAHSSLAGIALAVMLGVSPLPVALVWASAVAVLIWWLEKNTHLPSDTLIGILFTASMALGVILMSFTEGYQPELVSFLFGSILAIRPLDMYLILSFGLAILTWLTLSFRQLTFMSLSEDQAAISGIPVRLQTVILYISLAISTVLGVKILGIILVSALLIIPPATSRLLTNNLKSHVIMSLVMGELMVLSGLAVSYLYDLPSGATVILVGAGMFTLAALIGRKTA